MQTPVQITVRDMPHSEALDARIHEKAARLAEFHPNITSCRVVVEEVGKQHRQGRGFSVSIDVRVPGKELVASKSGDDVYVALREAFDAIKRQIEDHLRVQRGFVKAHAGSPPPDTEPE